jgi:hypothetical protein
MATRARLRQQFLAPAWDLAHAGRCRVEPKEVTKEKIGRSPDDADALLLAYLEWVGFGRTTPTENPGRGCPSPAWAGRRTRRGGTCFGRGKGGKAVPGCGLTARGSRPALRAERD